MIRIAGVFLVIIGCGGFGFSMAAAHKREEAHLQQLLRAVEYMDCELQFRQTPLPVLCRNVAQILTGPIAELFRDLSDELERQLLPDAGSCLDAALEKNIRIAPGAVLQLKELGNTLGLFDLPGQLRGLQAVRHQCMDRLDSLKENRESRLRSYQTLGLCAGAALAILLI